MSAGERHFRSRTRVRAVLGMLLLWIVAAPAFALGLGQIQVKSRPGEPLLAEIPIISSDPTELQGLQARLASPETFRRIGLEPPQGIVSDLQFTPAVDERGRPVIRVTSSAPVQQAGLTFLVEVDWGQGRLVREYSALVDAPRTVAAPVAPPVVAPAAMPAPVIQRPEAPAAAPPVASQPEPPPAPEPAPVAAPQPAAAPSQPPAAESVAKPASPPAAAPAAPAAEYGPVKRGQTLAGIAGGIEGLGDYSLDQTMLALLRTNPEAFIGQDINRLREGAVLRLPGADELSRYSASQASAMVREQVASWRAARRAQAQPAQEQATAASGDGAPKAAPAVPAEAKPAPRRVADARLEIAPPRADAGNRAGTQSGASAGGEGEMLRQELQQTKENLAARDAEVQDLKARVAELEQLQKQQQDLIALKDGALASAQQRLAQTNAAQSPAAPAQQPEPPSSTGWWWLLPLVLVLAAAAWWWRRRSAAPPRPQPQPARVSASFAAKPSPATAARGDAAAAEPAPAPAAPVWAGKATKPASAPEAPAQAVGDAPTWVAGDAGSTIQPLNQAPAGLERIELARAYADLGDRATARTLLQEVIDGGDPQARDEAARALQSLD